MWLALILFLGITGIVGRLNNVLPFKICPVCAGVSATWLLLTAMVLAGYAEANVFFPIILLLMGGSVVGIAYQGERSFAWARARPLLWKTAVIAIGMPLAFSASESANWPVFTVEVMALAGLAYLFFVRRQDGRASSKQSTNASEKVAELEERLKNCC